MPAPTRDAATPLQHRPTPKRDAFIQAKRVEHSAIGHVVTKNDELNRESYWNALKNVEQARVEAAIEAGDEDLTTAPPWALAMQRMFTEEIRGLKATMATEIAGVRTEIAGVKTEIAGLKTGIAGINNRLTGLGETISDVEHSVEELSAQVEDLGNTLRAVQVDVRQASAININRHVKIATPTSQWVIVPFSNGSDPVRDHDLPHLTTQEVVEQLSVEHLKKYLDGYGLAIGSLRGRGAPQTKDTLIRFIGGC
ncbi:hypothetical protein DFP72DRAFT_919219 [Ephemerocybe angulata]|uniref:Mug135-like C-terminal domain-containing protein n=1 Tax=Ephemerocybe angulata TaxID=980116 RepID=A0A8H6LYJ9_9AGAR|nr:hypothetical protein DFP72DRAFT_938444 [Tulosesus angulatus]KAF6747605.1 hypothetical protein DFP72DRAFT_919219 [Tulosesus angulatus]